jgi:chromosome segregation ATPase
MEWIKEILEGIANAEEIMAKINTELPKHFIPKDKYNKKAEELDTLQSQIKERDAQLEEFKSQVKDSAELTAQIEKLQSENEKQQQEFEHRIAIGEKSSILEKQLRSAGIKENYIEIAKKQFDLEKFNKNEAGELIGLTEELGKFKEGFADMFGEIKKVGQTPAPTGNPVQDAITQELFDAHRKDPKWINDNWEKVSVAMENGELK